MSRDRGDEAIRRHRDDQWTQICCRLFDDSEMTPSSTMAMVETKQTEREIRAIRDSDRVEAVAL